MRWHHVNRSCPKVLKHELKPEKSCFAASVGLRFGRCNIRPGSERAGDGWGLCWLQSFCFSAANHEDFWEFGSWNLSQQKSFLSTYSLWELEMEWRENLRKSPILDGHEPTFFLWTDFLCHLISSARLWRRVYRRPAWRQSLKRAAFSKNLESLSWMGGSAFSGALLDGFLASSYKGWISMYINPLVFLKKLVDTCWYNKFMSIAIFNRIYIYIYY